MDKLRKCCVCGVVGREGVEFSYGGQSYCKRCAMEYQRALRGTPANRAYKRAYMQMYRAEHPDYKERERLRELERGRRIRAERAQRRANIQAA